MWSEISAMGTQHGIYLVVHVISPSEVTQKAAGYIDARRVPKSLIRRDGKNHTISLGIQGYDLLVGDIFCLLRPLFRHSWHPDQRTVTARISQPTIALSVRSSHRYLPRVTNNYSALPRSALSAFDGCGPHHSVICVCWTGN